MHPTSWTPERLAQLNDRFGTCAPGEILHWSFELFGQRIVVATGFGPSGIVLIDLAMRIRPHTQVFYLDTDLLFEETYALRDRLQDRYGVEFTRVTGLPLDEQATVHGPELWHRDPDACCQLRKVSPLRRYLSGKQAWITGIRRDQSASRRHVGVIEWDLAHGLVKVNPLAHWTAADVWRYIDRHNLPYNPLHDEGFASIGCMPCTVAVAPGEDQRAGRWRGTGKTECGIHLQPVYT